MEIRTKIGTGCHEWNIYYYFLKMSFLLKLFFPFLVFGFQYLVFGELFIFLLSVCLLWPPGSPIKSFLGSQPPPPVLFYIPALFEFISQMQVDCFLQHCVKQLCLSSQLSVIIWFKTTPPLCSPLHPPSLFLSSLFICIYFLASVDFSREKQRAGTSDGSDREMALVQRRG